MERENKSPLKPGRRKLPQKEVSRRNTSPSTSRGLAGVIEFSTLYRQHASTLFHVGNSANNLIGLSPLQSCTFRTKQSAEGLAIPKGVTHERTQKSERELELTGINNAEEKGMEQMNP
uniref:Uncharacterized protein n=1 Tax=Bursaphelenchus xylophilus TaxID=6326 RepID=A0A1I7RSY9_BURXY